MQSFDSLTDNLEQSAATHLQFDDGKAIFVGHKARI